MSGIRVGCRGWDHPPWIGTFYPEDLPEDWRLGYYANAFRAVLVPDADLSAASSERLAGWLADVDEGFRFFAEVGPYTRALPGGAAAVLERLEVLRTACGGVVLAAPSAPVSWTASPSLWYRTLADRFPVAVRVSGDGSTSLVQAFLQAGARPVWRPGMARTEGLPACVGELDPGVRGLRDLRACVESFMECSGGCEGAFLCFPPNGGGWREMEQARVLLDLLGG